MNERFQQIEDANQHLKIDLDLTQERYDTQAIKAQKTKKELAEAFERSFELERDMRLLTLENQKLSAKATQVEAMAREVEEMKRKLSAAQRKASKWKSRALDIAKLAAVSPHGNFDRAGVHGNFSPTMARGDDSDSDIGDHPSGDEDEDDDDDDDLRNIWHAAFAPVKGSKNKRRGVSSAPGGSRQGSKLFNNKTAARSSTSMGLRRPGKGGPPLSNQFANFAVAGNSVRADSASSRTTSRSGSSFGGTMLPSVPNHVRSSWGGGL